MTILKPFLSFLFICLLGMAFTWALMSSIAQEQEQREQAAINKIKQAIRSAVILPLPDVDCLKQAG